MNDIEKSIPPQAWSSILNEKDLQDFIELRQINLEDAEILEKLSQLPKALFVEFHNFFNLTRDRSAQDLQRQLNNLGENEVERRKFRAAP